MEAVVLAGGYGTRLRPLTYRVPKPLLPIANSPMVMHLIDSMPPEVDKVVLAVSYKREMIEDYFNKNPVKGKDVVLVEEKTPMGTGGAIKNVEKEINGDFLAFNGDVISSADPSVIIKELKEKRAEAVISLWKVKDPSHYGVVEIDRGRIKRFVEKPAPGTEPSNLISAGTYALSYDILDLIPPGKVVSLEREIWPVVVEKGMYGMEFGGYWTDAGTRERVLEANGLIIKNAGKKVIFGNNTRIRGTVEGYTSVGDGVVLEEGGRIVNSIVMDNSIIESGAEVIDSIIGPDEVIKNKIENEIVCSNAR